MKRIIDVLDRLGLSLQTFKIAFAASVAWFVSTAVLQSHYPYFSSLAAILTVHVTVADSLKAAIQRISGTIAGVILSILIGHWLGIGPGAIFLMIFIGMAAGKALRLQAPVTSQIGISSLLVLALSQGHSNGYALGRITETVIGSLIAIVVNAAVVPTNAVPAAEKRILELSRLAAGTLENMAGLLQEKNIRDNAGQDAVMKLIKETGKSIEAIELAEQSLKFSPFPVRLRKRLAQLSQVMQRLEYITIQIRGIRKGIIDINPAMTGGANLEGLGPAIESTAECVAAFGRNVIEPLAWPLPLLTGRLDEARFRQELCLAQLTELPLSLLRDTGGILTDLNRILREVEVRQEGNRPELAKL
ncbi:Hypothetical protein LUCI_4399 [Lucifera butyrica]|uniref:Integral membrane bound transporter domain-containing protein n=1 Tax=Lucifera butyrica TaxID=1351585 RepID=A0A498RG91_9FIRM|nr:FUSC family protein [Lucifera butyrica]VBB09113.1 Hypothetical protein LUCI_4399 [Lucifera butyrica]